MNSICNAVYVELGERPDLDRLLRCSAAVAFSAEAGWLDRCPVHLSQLDWVRRDPARLAAYNQLVADYDLSQQLAAGAAQEALL